MGAYKDVVVSCVEDDNSVRNCDGGRDEETGIIFVFRQLNVAVVLSEPEQNVNYNPETTSFTIESSQRTFQKVEQCFEWTYVARSSRQSNRRNSYIEPRQAQ